MNDTLSRFLMACGFIVATVTCSPLSAATYTVDTGSSGLTVGGFLLAEGLTLTDQFPGSNTASLVGTFDANVTGPVGAETVSFLGSDFIDALALALPINPLIGAAIGNIDNDEINADGSVGDGDGVFSPGEDNIGVVQLTLNANFAFRNVQFFLGGEATVGSPATSAELGVSEGFAGATTSVNGFEQLEVSLITDSGPNDTDIVESVGYSLVGDLETITVPFKITLDADPLILTFTGQIVGSRVVVIPEPTAFAFVGFGLCSALVRRRRR